MITPVRRGGRRPAAVRHGHGRNAGATAGRLAAAVLAALIGACATPPPGPPAMPPPAPSAPVCVVCADRSAEIARLEQELARRDAELRELRARQREKAQALAAAAREAQRASVRRHRLATQADAASYLAEVEVALEAARPTPGQGGQARLVAIARQHLDDASARFAQDDYAAAMDLAAQAEQLARTVAGDAPSASPRRAAAGTSFTVPVMLRTTSEGYLRSRPQGRSRAVATLAENTPLVARGYREGWLRVDAPGGRSGWIYQTLVGAR